MITFETAPSLGSDNHSGVHPEIMDAILAVNRGHVPAYGIDPVSQQATEVFRRHFGAVEVALVFNGTAANVLALRSMMPSHAAVLCCSTAHLHVDECAAPEFHVGCKVQAVPHVQGKITPQAIEAQMVRTGDQHYATPRVVSVTQATELGTVYTLEELRAIEATCRTHGLLLHMDGSRLLNAAAYLEVPLKELTAGVDVLSFGGTKNGLMLGEAVVFFNSALARDFAYIRKQGMQLGSKLRFVAAQFIALLQGDLWLRNAQHAHAMACRLAAGAAAVPGVRITQPVQSNAVFAQFPRAWLKALRRQSFFYVWSEAPFEVRWMTSFDSTAAQIDAFVDALKEAAAANAAHQTAAHM